MKYKFLSITNDDGAGIITITRPPANAISFELLLELKEMVRDIETNKDIRSVIFKSGVDGFFCAGADLADMPPEIISKLTELLQTKGLRDALKEIIPEALESFEKIFKEVTETFSMIESLKKPTIAAINGHALGGGLELALLCDFRFMGNNSGKIGLPEIKLGLMPLGGGTQRLPRLIGQSKALEIMLTGKKLNSSEALSAGIINDVFDQEYLDEGTLDFAKKLARGPIGAMGLIKNAVIKGLRGTLSDGLIIERNSFNELIESEEMIDDIVSFLEKGNKNG